VSSKNQFRPSPRSKPRPLVAARTASPGHGPPRSYVAEPARSHRSQKSNSAAAMPKTPKTFRQGPRAKAAVLYQIEPV